MDGLRKRKKLKVFNFLRLRKPLAPSLFLRSFSQFTLSPLSQSLEQANATVEINLKGQPKKDIWAKLFQWLN